MQPEPKLHIRLVPIEPNHGPKIFEAVRESVAEISPWMPWCHPAYSLSEAEAWVKIATAGIEAKTAYEYAIETPSGRLLGCGGLNQIDPVNRRCNLGYWIRTSETGRGHASAAVRALRDWAFRETDLVRLEILIAQSNSASLRVAEKCRARREGTLYSRFFLHGSFHDAALYSIVRENSAAA